MVNRLIATIIFFEDHILIGKCFHYISFESYIVHVQLVKWCCHCQLTVTAMAETRNPLDERKSNAHFAVTQLTTYWISL